MRIRLAAAACATATIPLLALTPGTANAHVGNYCGHGSGPSHLHAPLTNTTSQFVRHNTYVHLDGSRTHYHLYRVHYYYAGTGVSRTDYEWKRCN